ncbi:methyltransferase-like protein 17, mitochondrial isoform X2 [Dreissena polymorpha]|uniref:methyltransferase-like protein 17, mitochondrial isoform X2 n=1 Tax=Dreissena polymorpha TaxID=45954 RepID=UPI0022645470|nr:methyltransferase-like protein 17, mitochondrial isoform X2 [Dreissena polymorpha]
MKVLRGMKHFANKAPHIELQDNQDETTANKKAFPANWDTKPLPQNWVMDPEELKKCQEDPLGYPKQHSGIMMMTKTPKLPELLEKNARAILEEKDLIANSQFTKEVTRLHEVYARRQPPVEAPAKAAKMTRIAQEVYQEKLSKLGKPLEEVTEEDMRKIDEFVKTVTHKIYKHSTHNYVPIDYSSHKCYVYLATRLAVNFRVLHQIFHEMKKLDTNFAPSAVLNVGSGVGSAIWAGNTIWGESVLEYYCVDPSNAMNDMARELLAYDRKNPLKLAVKGVNFRQFIPSDKHKQNKFPLVVSAYALLEQTSRSKRLELVEDLWNLTDKYLVLVELGTKAGYHLIMEARDTVLQFGTYDSTKAGHVFAPCMHDEACPKLTYNLLQCNFTVEYKALQLDVDRGQGSSTQSERYSYVVLKKGPRPEEHKNQYPRIVESKTKSDHVPCMVCLPDGSLRRFTVTKSFPSIHMLRCAKHCQPGDFLPCHIPTHMTQKPISDDLKHCNPLQPTRDNHSEEESSLEKTGPVTSNVPQNEATS